MTDPLSDALSRQVDEASPPLPPSYDAVLARRVRRRTRRRVAAVAAVAAVVTVAVAVTALPRDDRGSPGPAAVDPSTTAPTTTATGPAPTGIPDVAPTWDEKGAPPVFLQLDDGEVPLEASSSCYLNGTHNRCFRGEATRPFADAGARATVPFSFPDAGWTFEATFSPLGAGSCARHVTVPVETTGDHTFLARPAGGPGRYRVDLSGRGPGGSVSTTFAWTTTERGAVPGPSGYLGLVSDDGDDYRAYPPELGLDDLATTPRRASATITVTAADGASRTFGPVAPDDVCYSEGQLYFRADGDAGGQPFDLGPAPFGYRVEVVLDGTTYVGTAVWPRDERADEAPYTDLVFAPPLPRYDG